MEPVSYRLTLLPSPMSLCRLAPDAGIPDWVENASLLSITRTNDELSIICDAHLMPENVQAEGGWRAFKMIGPLEFTMVGVLAAILNPLAEAQVSILAISTYDTDYVLVTDPDLPAALAALHQAGHQVSV
ncbi:MAG: ACT domain-containing protein [Bellilinea sp.]